MSPSRLPLGPVITAVSGLTLDDADRRRLRHPLVGGVTLFARNYFDPEQLTQLCREIHALRLPQLLIAVDHEGGRVQRFREGFTRLPPMRRIGALWDRDSTRAKAVARAAGVVMATELKRCGVDLSYAPVLDIDHGASTIIGDRALHRDPTAIVELASSLLDGMSEAGMVGVGKHFPGHGFIAADSHLELPVDDRDLGAIRGTDLQPFGALAHRLAAIMPAHVLYAAADARPAGFSRFWLQTILRAELGFDGAIFSDDLGMEGASGEGGMAARARAALEAGCDLVLACTPEGADALLAELRYDMPAAAIRRLIAMFGTQAAEQDPQARDDRLAMARRELTVELA